VSSSVFAYQGPAVIGGVDFAEVALRERRDPFRTHLWTWEGTAVLPLAAWPPPLFGMPDAPTLTLELPDGRTGEVCGSVRFDEGRWILEIMGEGPAPGPVTTERQESTL